MTVIHTGPPPAEPAGDDVILSAGGWLFEPKGELWERDDRQVFTWQEVCAQGPVAIYRNESDLPPADVIELARAIVADPHHADHILELREDGWTNQKPIEPPKYGDPARAKCSAPGRSLGGRLVLYVSAQDNDLYVDEWDPNGEPVVLNLPMPSNDALRAANAGLRYSPPTDVMAAGPGINLDPPVGIEIADPGVKLIAEKRAGHEAKGYTALHDAAHSNGELAIAAACYATPPDAREYGVQTYKEHGRTTQRGIPISWPWGPIDWHPKRTDRIGELAVAGSLIAAEIGRLLALRADAS